MENGAIRPGILVVDDEPSFRLLISDLLKTWGYPVFTAANGLEALEIIKDDVGVTIVLADLVMPWMDGLELLKAIKERQPHTFVILVTSQATVDTAVEALKGGAYDYLTKPLQLERLKTLLDNCTRQMESDSVLAMLTGPVFLSYAREDLEVVRKIYRQLRLAKFQPWMDVEDLVAGEKWRDAIESAIRNASFFVACLSEHSISKRGMFQTEMKVALDVWKEHLDSDIYLIPVRLTDCVVPPNLRDFQWVDYFAPDGWDRLVDGVRKGLLRRAGKGHRV